MPAAGEYDTPLVRQVAARAGSTTTGNFPITYQDAEGVLWAAVSQESGTEQDEYGAKRLVVYATIRIRNYPDLAPEDRLYDPEWEETYVVEGIRRGDDELVVDARKVQGVG